MIELSPGSRPDVVKVLFRLTLSQPKSPGEPPAPPPVELLSEFDGWARGARRLDFVRSKDMGEALHLTYETSAELPRDRTYEFCYLVRGTTRYADVEVKEKTTDHDGQEYSVFDTPAAAVEPKQEAPKVPVAIPEPRPTDPQRRLALAARTCEEARAPGATPEERLRLLSLAVELDPYDAQYRLALAAAKRGLGRLDQAADDYRTIETLFGKNGRVALLRAETLLDAGKVQDARDALAAVPTEDGPLARQAAFDRVEIALRTAASPEDWQKAADDLGRIRLDEDGAGLFCEKCVKIVVESGSADVAARVKRLADERLGSYGESLPAYAMLCRLAEFDPVPVLAPEAESGPAPAAPGGGAAPPIRDPLERLLMSVRLAAASRAHDGDPASCIGHWQRLVARCGTTWPELKDAYLARLDTWAERSYQSKHVAAAELLWGEAERIDPANPAVLQNLALAATRLRDERAHDWYWDRLVRTWSLYGETMPEADGYAHTLIQKHQAFVDAFQKAASLTGDWRTQLELLEGWAREAVSLLALRQIAFANPLFRCGICRDDYHSPDERVRMVEASAKGMRAWLDMSAAWAGLPEQGSALRRWRLERLEEARTAALLGGPGIRRHYDPERAAFKLHRESAVLQFIQLMVLLSHLQDHAPELDETERARYRTVAMALMAFPHEALKSGVLEKNTGLTPDADLNQIVTGMAVLPWFLPAKNALENRQVEVAEQNLRQVRDIAPDYLPALFYLAQCHAASERYDKAYEVARDALARCGPDDEIRSHLATLTEQMDIGRARQRAESMEGLLKGNEPDKAVAEGEAILAEMPEHPYVLFMLGQAYMATAELDKARDAFRRVRRSTPPEGELGKAARDALDQVNKLAPRIILSRAVPRMQNDEWEAARNILARGRLSLRSPDARLTFYEGVCLSRLGKTDKAEQTAREALGECRAGVDDELKGEIEGFIPQIAMAVIADELRRAQQALESKQWRKALDILAPALKKAPTAAVAHFYRAICLLNLDRDDEAERAAQEGLSHAEAEANKPLADQLKQVLSGISARRKMARMNAAVQAMNRSDWSGAMRYLEEELRAHATEPQAHYYMAICLFRSCVAELQGGSAHGQSMREYAESKFNEAERHLVVAEMCLLLPDPDLKKGVEQLREAMKNVRGQLGHVGW